MARRVPVITRDQVTEGHRAAYDEITAIRGRPPVVGPSSVLVNSPEMALRVNRLSDYLGQLSAVSDRERRLAALVAARSMDCQYIWAAQVAGAREAGLSDEVVNALRDRKPLPAMAPNEAAVVNYAVELTTTNQVSEKTFQAALQQLGVQGLTEFTTHIGYYRMLALTANAFTIDLPQQRTEPLLPI